MDSNLQPSNPGLSLKIFIITLVVAILAVSVMAAFFSAQAHARDQIRIRDVTLLTKFLEAYKTNQGYYPPASNGTPTDWAKYLEKLPTAPAADGACTSQQNTYRYSVENSGQMFRLSFCLGSAAGQYRRGINTVTKP